MRERKEYKQGDRIQWEYTHSLNAKSKIRRKKQGIFVEYVHWGGEPKARVLFDGNSTISTIPLEELEEPSEQ